MDQQKVYKKLAEVAAIISLLEAIDTRSGNKLFTAVLDSNTVNTLLKSNLSSLVPPAYEELYSDKYQRTTAKLTSMAELYIGDKWDDTVELSEWCGFHLGAGLVHAALVRDCLTEHSTMLSAVTDSFQILLSYVSEHISKQP